MLFVDGKIKHICSSSLGKSILRSPIQSDTCSIIYISTSGRNVQQDQAHKSSYFEVNFVDVTEKNMFGFLETEI